MKTLREFAQEHRFSYRTAWNYFKAGKIAAARKNKFGKILIEESTGKQKSEAVGCYARGASSD